MRVPAAASVESVYGQENLENAIKLVTLAPELTRALEHVRTLRRECGVRVSMGHSAASHEEGVDGVEAGATLITHTFNATKAPHHREPSLVGKKPHSNVPFRSLYSASECGWRKKTRTNCVVHEGLISDLRPSVLLHDS